MQVWEFFLAVVTCKEFQESSEGEITIGLGCFSPSKSQSFECLGAVWCFNYYLFIFILIKKANVVHKFLNCIPIL